jgi:hypothetical protein
MRSASRVVEVCGQEHCDYVVKVQGAFDELLRQSIGWIGDDRAETHLTSLWVIGISSSPVVCGLAGVPLTLPPSPSRRFVAASGALSRGPAGSVAFSGLYAATSAPAASSRYAANVAALRAR